MVLPLFAARKADRSPAGGASLKNGTSALVELSAGPIEYRDSGGEGPALVLVHGVLMDGGQWRDVLPHLNPRYRCILPTLPLGGHRLPMKDTADLSLAGQARLLAEFLEALDLRDATLAFNDWAAPQLLIADGLANRVSGMILVACETAGNYPPGLPGKNLALLGSVPGGLRLALSAMRFRAARNLPFTFGWMAKHGMPEDLVSEWLHGPWRDPAVLQDARRYIRGTREGRRKARGSNPRTATVRGAGHRGLGGRGPSDADERGQGARGRVPELAPRDRRGQLRARATRPATPARPAVPRAHEWAGAQVNGLADVTGCFTVRGRTARPADGPARLRPTRHARLGCRVARRSRRAAPAPGARRAAPPATPDENRHRGPQSRACCAAPPNRARPARTASTRA